MKEFNKEQIVQVIEGRGHLERTPILYDRWIYPWIYEERREIFEDFMNKQIRDVDYVHLVLPDNFTAPRDDPNYKWALEGITSKEGVGLVMPVS